MLKSEKGHSGKGVRVGAVNTSPDESIESALSAGNYIVQEKIPLSLWAEELPELEDGKISIRQCRTDFRCMIGQTGPLGFMTRYGGIPTNVGSGGGLQPLATLGSDMDVRDAANCINDAIMDMNPSDILEVLDE